MPAPDEEPPAGLLLVTIDRLPAWMLPAHGCTWVAMPELDAVAGRGVVLDRVIATSDSQADAIAELLTVPRAPEPGLAAAAASLGWRPLLITDDADMAALAWPGTTVRLVPATDRRPAATPDQTWLARVCEAAVAVAGAGHRLAWCHLTSLGRLWDAPPAFREAYADPDDPPLPPVVDVPDLTVTPETDPDVVVGMRQAFAGQLTLLDECLARLVDAFTGDGGWSILVAGVRGLGLGVHGRLGPGPMAPFGELIHLPTIFVDHRGRMAAQRHGGLVVPADLGATLRALIDPGLILPTDTAGDPRGGRSLGGLLAAWQPPARDRVICRATGGTAVATPAWQFVLPSDARAGMLFAKPDDYFERCDVADRSGEVADELLAVARLAATDPLAAWSRPLSPAALGG